MIWLGLFIGVITGFFAGAFFIWIGPVLVKTHYWDFDDVEDREQWLKVGEKLTIYNRSGRHPVFTLVRVRDYQSREQYFAVNVYSQRWIEVHG